MRHQRVLSGDVPAEIGEIVRVRMIPDFPDEFEFPCTPSTNL